jgi:hypothetical protein
MGWLVAAAAIPSGTFMLVRRLRPILGGEIADGTIVDVRAARAGGPLVYHLYVETETPPVGTLEVRAYREFEIDARVRVRYHSSMPGIAWLADWSHLGYELMIGFFVLAAGVLAVVAVA